MPAYDPTKHKPSAATTKRMTLILHEDDFDRLRTFCYITNRQMTDVYREAVVTFLDEHMTT